jgi:uncharacterized protein (DUF486 family)
MLKLLATIALLVGSNAFMTTAWYYHLKRTDWSIVAAIAISWLIALPEYCLQVPANRIGHTAFGGPLSAPQLKILQEGITLVVFSVFSVLILKERLRWTDIVAFVLIFAAVAVSVLGRQLIKDPAAPLAG